MVLTIAASSNYPCTENNVSNIWNLFKHTNHRRWDSSTETFLPSHLQKMSDRFTFLLFLFFLFFYVNSFISHRLPLCYSTSRICPVCNRSVSLCKCKQKMETLVITEVFGTLLATCQKQSVISFAAVITEIKRIIHCYLPVTNNKTLRVKS